MSFELKEGRIFNPFFFSISIIYAMIKISYSNIHRIDFREILESLSIEQFYLAIYFAIYLWWTRPFPHFTQGDFVLESSCQFRIQCGRFSLILQSKVCAKIISLNCRLFVLTSCTRCLYVHGNFGGSIL